MSTPIGHSIVGYTLARMFGVKSPLGQAAAMGVASLPDVDFIMGYVANGDALSLHHRTITHRPAFPVIVGAAAGVLGAGFARLRGRKASASDVLRPAALATALVGSHVAMDPLPLPYRFMWYRWGSFWQVVAANGWNAVVDLAVYGGLALLILNGNGHEAETAEA
jgi:hypothetical protein